MLCYKLSPVYISHHVMINTWMNSVVASSEEKKHQSIILSHLQKSLVPTFWNNVGILFLIQKYFKFCIMTLN